MVDTVIELNKEQRQKLEAALINAFPDANDMARLVDYKLDKDLSSFSGQTYSNIIYNLIRWANANGKIADLVLGALDENPLNRLLIGFAAEIGLMSLETEPEKPPPGPKSPPPEANTPTRQAHNLEADKGITADFSSGNNPSTRRKTSAGNFGTDGGDYQVRKNAKDSANTFQQAPRADLERSIKLSEDLRRHKEENKKLKVFLKQAREEISVITQLVRKDEDASRSIQPYLKAADLWRDYIDTCDACKPKGLKPSDETRGAMTRHARQMADLCRIDAFATWIKDLELADQAALVGAHRAVCARVETSARDLWQNLEACEVEETLAYLQELVAALDNLTISWASAQDRLHTMITSRLEKLNQESAKYLGVSKT